MEKHLKPAQYYIDLYDRMTVEYCRKRAEIYRSKTVDDFPLIGGQKPSEKLASTLAGMMSEWMLMFETGHRYTQKQQAIEEMMKQDEARDQLYESAQAPEYVQCLKCRSTMFLKFKDLNIGYREPDQVLFMYECPNNCRPRRAFYDNGEEWKRPRPELCPKCSHELNSADATTKKKFITILTCPSCAFTKTEEIERTVHSEEPDPNFEADRARFCLSEEKGKEWIESLENMKNMEKFMKEQKEKEEHKDLYDKVAKLQKLTILDLEQLLTPVLEKAGYVKLQMSPPEIGKDVIVPFGVHDSKNERARTASEYELKRLLKKTLEATNWRLMSDGVSYRLGFLNGRLRGYDREEDMLALVRKGRKNTV